MTRLELARRIARECRMTASANVPATTINQTGNLLDAVTWLDDAWLELQAEQMPWRWMIKNFTLTTVIGIDTYEYSDCIDVPTSGAITRFDSWKFVDPMSIVTSYLQSAGVNTQGYVYYLPWETFRLTYLVGTIQSGQPAHITIDPQNRIQIGPIPNEVYVLGGEYKRSPQIMTLDEDVPEMPAQFHNLLIYDAMRKYAGAESAAEIMLRANTEGARVRSQLNMNQLPAFRIGGPLA